MTFAPPATCRICSDTGFIRSEFKDTEKVIRCVCAASQKHECVDHFWSGFFGAMIVEVLFGTLGYMLWALYKTMHTGEL